MIRPIKLLFLRRPLFPAVLAAALAAAVAFCVAAGCTWYAASRQLTDIGTHYTTAAIPNEPLLPGSMPVKEKQGILNIINSKMDLDQVLEHCPVEYRLDRRAMLGAVVKGCRAAILTRQEPNTDGHTMAADHPYNMGVLAVRCERASRWSESQWEYTFTVERTLCAIDRGYPQATRYTSLTLWTGEDRAAAFEVGKTYILRGNFGPSTYKYSFADTDASVPAEARTGLLYLELGSAGDRDYQEDRGGDGNTYHVRKKGSPPLYAEYTGPLDDFLASDQGRVWREEIIPAVEQNYSAAKLILTDNVDSVYQFNTGLATLLSGRSISAGEYASGERVCLISQEFAALNGLSVGDTLSMDLYRPKVDFERTLQIDAQERLQGDASTHCISIDPCLPENTLNITAEYEIVGVYTCESTYYGLFPFSPSMIFAPKASVAGAEEYAQDLSQVPSMNSVILPNHDSAAFDGYMRSLGWEDSFLYCDQDYTALRQTLLEVRRSAARLLAAAAATLAAVTAVYLFLLSSLLNGPLLLMRRAGVGAGACFRQTLGPCLVLLGAAAALGGGGGAALFSSLSAWVSARPLAFSPTAALCVTALLLLLLAALQSLFLRRLCQGGVMKRHGR